MKTLKVKVEFFEDVLGTANADPKIHEEWIASKAPDIQRTNEETESVNPKEEFEKAMTVFSRNQDGQPIVWDYQWKGFFKDAFKALKKVPGSECGKIKAYKQDIDGLVFVYPRRIPIELSGPITICQRPLRASTPQGERVALASSESAPAGSSMIFYIVMLNETMYPAIIEALGYGSMRGFGQWRNSGKGRFKCAVLEDTDGKMEVEIE